jgi:hypothetical protein
MAFQRYQARARIVPEDRITIGLAGPCYFR